MHGRLRLFDLPFALMEGHPIRCRESEQQAQRDNKTLHREDRAERADRDRADAVADKIRVDHIVELGNKITENRRQRKAQDQRQERILAEIRRTPGAFVFPGK